jgi:prepilin-type N-terminal cleavage/methylation domain-containing protein
MNKFQKAMPAGSQGFTLIEILMVIAIISILSMLWLMNIPGQLAHATDARRKMDVYSLTKFFEDYYNDHDAFPAQNVIDLCGSPVGPYLVSIPCDPVLKEPYGYFPASNGGYRICVKLADKTDIAIASMNCDGPKGCGVDCGYKYNYCLSSGVPASAVNTEDEVHCI